MNLVPNILIVDDQQENILLLELALKALDVNMIQAASGFEALNKTKGITLALAILDVHMPGMNGYELAKRLNEERAGVRVPIIFITANYAAIEQILEGYGSGAVDYIFKPINNSILRSKVRAFIDLFNQKLLIIRDMELLRRSTEVVSETDAILNRIEKEFIRFFEPGPDGETEAGDEPVVQAVQAITPAIRATHRDIAYTLRTFRMGIKKQSNELARAIVDAEVASENYARSYDFAPSGYFTLSTQGVIVQLNHSAAVMMGLDHDELLNNRFDGYISKESLDDFSAFFRQIFKSGEKGIVELIINPAEGEPRYVHVEGIVSGNGEQGLLSLVDITERKKVEGALRASEVRFRALAASANDAIVTINADGVISGWNTGAEKIFGFSEQEIIGSLVDQIIPARFSMLHSAGIRHVENGGSRRHANRTMEIEGMRKGGEVFPAELSWSSWETTSEKLFTGIIRDITSRKKAELELLQLNEQLDIRVKERTDELLESNRSLRQAEEKFRTIANFTYDWEYWLDRDDRFIFCSSSCEKVTGYSSTQFMENSSLLSEIVHPDDAGLFRSIHDLVMQSERGINEVQYRIIRADGSVCWIGNGSHAVYDQQGNFMGIRGSNRDISDRKRIESLLISSNQNIVKTIIQTEENERANFSKELHDGLGPLLSAIKMYLQWSQRPKSSNSREEIIIKAQDILEDALTTVKEISNKLSPRLLINYGLTSAVQSFVDKLEETSAITIDFRSNTARRFTNEIEVTLYRVLIECINNTMKHAGANRIRINLIDSGNQIRLEYSDDGSGFNMAEVLSEQKGLGLFNLQNRIQTIGGKISLSSEPGKGVDYRVTIDLEEEHILKS